MTQVGAISGSILSTLGQTREDAHVKGRHQSRDLIGDSTSSNSKYC
jgi:hypothetical protein